MFERAPVDRVLCGTGSGLLLCLDASVPQPALEARRGTVRAVYIDPPFMTGGDFTRHQPFGEKDWANGRASMELPGYADRFPSREAWLRLLRGLMENARALLGPGGVFMVHLDWRSGAYARLLCDELFGEEHFINEIVWAYESGGRARRSFSRKHDVILIYGVDRRWLFDPDAVAVPREQKRRRNHMKRGVDEDGRGYASIRVNGKEYRYYDDVPVCPSDVWTDISHLQQRDPERTGWPTQKPQALLRRLLAPFVRPGDTVADLTCGSGTALAAARELGCRFIGVDVSPEAISLCQARLESRDLLADAPQEPDDAVLSGWCDASGAAVLTGIGAAHPAFPPFEDPLEPLDGRCIGRIRGDVLYAEDIFHRSVRTPALPPMAILPPGEGDIGVLTIDAAGRRRVYRWVDD